MKNLKDSNKIMLISVIVIVFAVIFYILTDIFVSNSMMKFLVAAGVGLGLLIYIVISLVKLKKDGSIYDERDSYIDGETSFLALRIFQIILALIVIFTYGLDNLDLNISQYTLLLFFTSMIIYSVVNIIKKRKA